MRIRTLRALFSTLFVIAILLAGGLRSVYAQSVTPLLQATVGTGANTSYFVLDFKSGPDPQSFAFAYKYDGAKTGGDLIDALAANVPGFSVDYQTFSFGRFYQSFTYNGETLDTPADFSSFWSYWISDDGTNWTSPQTFGADARTLTNGSWDGWTYAAGGVSTAPTTPLLSSAAPEPGTLSLGLVGGLSLIGIAVRRRKP